MESTPEMILENAEIAAELKEAPAESYSEEEQFIKSLDLSPAQVKKAKQFIKELKNPEVNLRSAMLSSVAATIGNTEYVRELARQKFEKSVAENDVYGNGKWIDVATTFGIDDAYFSQEKFNDYRKQRWLTRIESGNSLDSAEHYKKSLFGHEANEAEQIEGKREELLQFGTFESIEPLLEKNTTKRMAVNAIARGILSTTYHSPGSIEALSEEYKTHFALSDQEIEKAVIEGLKAGGIENVKHNESLRRTYPYINTFLASPEAKDAALSYVKNRLIEAPGSNVRDVLEYFAIGEKDLDMESLKEKQRLNELLSLRSKIEEKDNDHLFYKLEHAQKILHPEDWQQIFSQYKDSPELISGIVKGIANSYDMQEKIEFLEKINLPEEQRKHVGKELLRMGVAYSHANDGALKKMQDAAEHLGLSEEGKNEAGTLGIVDMLKRGTNLFYVKKAAEQLGIERLSNSQEIQKSVKDAYLECVEKGEGELLEYMDKNIEILWQPEEKAERKHAMKIFLTDSYKIGTMRPDQLKNFINAYYPETHKIYLLVDPEVRESVEKHLSSFAFQSDGFSHKPQDYVKDMERLFLLTPGDMARKVTEKIEQGSYQSNHYAKANLKAYFPDIDIEKENKIALENNGAQIVEQAFESSDWALLNELSKSGNEKVVQAIQAVVEKQEMVVNDATRSAEQRTYALQAMVAMTNKFEKIASSGVLQNKANVASVIEKAPIDTARINTLIDMLPQYLINESWVKIYDQLKDVSPEAFEKHSKIVSLFPENVIATAWQVVYDSLKDLEGEQFSVEQARLARVASTVSPDKIASVYSRLKESTPAELEKYGAIASAFSKNFFSANWEFLYGQLKDAEGAELEQKKSMLQSIEKHQGSLWLRGTSVQKNFLNISQYSPEQQAVYFNTIASFEAPAAFAEEQWPVLLLQYIAIIEEQAAYTFTPEYKEQIKQLFAEGSPFKDTALEGMQHEWKQYLSGGHADMTPPILALVGQLTKSAGGAGNLKHVESLSGLLQQLDSAQKAKTTVPRSSEELNALLGIQEKRMDKDGWSQDDRSEFYNLSSDIMRASPSLYASFSPIVETLSAKEMKAFAKDILPLYQAELVTLQKADQWNETISYNARELAGMRQHIDALSASLATPAADRKELLEQEKQRLIEGIKEGFKERFGILKVPESFNKEHMRAIQNGVRYIGNINERNAAREAVVVFYLALELNDQWGAFREGKEINVSEYLSNSQAQILQPLLEQKKAGMAMPLEVAGIDETQAARFQELLQGEVSSSMIGNIETVDTKLGNIKRNIDELSDPDIYQTSLEKGLVVLLAEEGKNIGSVLAKTFAEASGKQVTLAPEEQQIQAKIAALFDIPQFTPAEVKRVQDYIQPFALINNIVTKINAENVEAEIDSLQALLVPDERVVEIFNRLGEDFTQESGAFALSKDLSYLEGLLVKDDKKILPEERAVIEKYIGDIREKMKELETTLQKVKDYFDKLKKSSHAATHPILGERLREIEKVINSTSSSTMIVSRMTKDLNLIIENMRQCLGCLRKEANNDTNLAFGDYNKFFIINQAEKEQGSISDEIVFFAPVTNLDGEKEMSFIMDRVYGSKSPDALLSNVQSVYKKYQAIKKEMPDAKLSISVTYEAMQSAGLSATLFTQKVGALLADVHDMEEFSHKVADIPKSAFSDNYIEFGTGDARSSGARTFSGVSIR